MTDLSAALSGTPLSQRLKAHTRATHAALDKSIMACGIFASRTQFAQFLRAQYRFHRDIDALYDSAELAARSPGLADRRRLQKIADDLNDLGMALPPPASGTLRPSTTLPNALGWLYVAEGSKLGGAMLFKLAGQRLGLGSEFGARHLAAHPDGVERHWREFTAVLDTAALAPTQDEDVLRAAEQAFQTMHGYVQEEMRAATDRPSCSTPQRMGSTG